MKYYKISFVVSFLLTLSAGPLFAANEDYAAQPPFLPEPVSPNLLIVVDRSGSMNWSAYNPQADKTGWCGISGGCGWTFTGAEEGYFVPTANYTYSNGATGSEGDGGIWEPNTTNVPDPICPGYWNDVYGNTNTYTGACLNFLLMSRLDLVRWAMTGGRPDACTDGEYQEEDCDPSIQCTGADCVIRSTYNDLVRVPTTRIDDAIIQQYANADLRPRFGLLFYSDSLRAQKVYVGDYPNDGTTSYNADPNMPFTYFSRLLNAMSANNGTGTAPALWEAYDYFKQANDHDFSNDFDMADSRTRYRDPLYVCDWERDNCELVPCAKNFVILATDGQWNIGGANWDWTCSIDTGYENNSADPVVPSYRMHYDVLRTVTSNSGTVYDKQVDAVFGLGLFLQGTGLTSLQNTAMYGGFDFSQGNQYPGTLTGYPLTTCTMDDCGDGRGSACTPLPVPSSSDWDTDGDGLPDTFANAGDGAELKASIKELIDEATSRAAAGSSISVLSERATSGSVIHQALFYPTKPFGDYTVNWTGALNAYWFFRSTTVSNIREDNTEPFYLNRSGDNILDFVINASGNLTIDYFQPDADGEATLPRLGTYNNVDQVNKIFESGEILRDRAAGNRVIYGVGENDTSTPFTTANSSSFDTLLDPSTGQAGTDFDACLGTTPLDRAENLIDYIRGTADSFTSNTGGDCRSRLATASNDRWKLGDIIHSTPALVQYADSSLVFVSSNDGMLHAFEAGAIRTDGLASDQEVRLCEHASGDCFDTGNTTASNDIGREAWAFVPKNAMPYLKYIADPDYQHIYTVDLAPYHIRHGNRDIIIGGMRFGGATGCTSGGDWCGDPAQDEQVVPPECTATSPDCLGLSSYFALDVTDPANPIFLWEFSDPGMGFSYTGPAYITRGADHYVMFANGPINHEADITNQDLRFFILKVDADFNIMDVNGGGVDDSDIFKISGASYTGYGVTSGLSSFNQTFGGRLFNNGMDWDEDGSTDLVFMGINQKTGGVWSGNVMSITPRTTDPLGIPYNDPTNKKDHPGSETVNWDFNQVFTSAQSPVTSKVVFGNCFNNPMIYFGTGRWFFKNDEEGQNVNDKESLHAIKILDCLDDIAAGNNCNMNFAHSNSFSCADLTNPQMGWTIDDDLLPRGGNYNKERTITDPTFSDQGMIFFTTMQPSENPCDFGGRTRIWGLNCASGDSIWAGCSGSAVTNTSGALFLQLSGGNIENPRIDRTDFSEEGDRATEWKVGIPPESAPPFVPYSPTLNGEIILWLER